MLKKNRAQQLSIRLSSWHFPEDCDMLTVEQAARELNSLSVQRDLLLSALRTAYSTLTDLSYSDTRILHAREQASAAIRATKDDQ